MWLMKGGGILDLVGIDGVLVINLARRPDRWTAFKMAWADQLPWGKARRIDAIDGRSLSGFGRPPWFRGRRRDPVWAGRAGCALSHRKAMETARDLGWDTVLILEDDAIPGDTDALTRLDVALRRDDWDLFYLGCGDVERPIEQVDTGVYRIGGALDLHAYVLRARVRDWILARLPEQDDVWAWIASERAVDRWISRETCDRFKVLALHPAAAVQDDNFSDITQRARSDNPAPLKQTLTLARARHLPRSLSRVIERIEDRVRARIKKASGF